MNGKIFLDTNVCIYLTDLIASPKKETVSSLLLSKPFISPQVVFECINVCRRKLKYDEKESIVFVEYLLSCCSIVPENTRVVNDALQLWQKHQFQPFDAKIVATALEAGCHTLYSEDMQHGFVVNRSLTIVNPFI